jgi:hypothetical protein
MKRFVSFFLMLSMATGFGAAPSAGQSGSLTDPSSAKLCARLYLIYGGDTPEYRQMLAKAASLNGQTLTDMEAHIEESAAMVRRSVAEGRFDEADSRLVFNNACQQKTGIARPVIKIIPKFEPDAAARMEVEKAAQIERIARLQAQNRIQVSAAPAYSTPSPAPTGASDAECTRIMNEGVERATSDMMKARQWVQAWIKMGAGGSALGGDYVRNGCNVINSTINRVNAAQCPGEYASALERFRYDYYIGLPTGGQMNCN